MAALERGSRGYAAASLYFGPRFASLKLHETERPLPKLNLGLRLKTLRQQKGLTLRELARQAKVSASFISQLELNQASPTIANFEKICSALKMSLVDVLRDEPLLQEPIPVPLSDDHPLAMRWQRAWMRHLLPQDTPNPFTALQLTLDVGGETPSRSSRRSINELAVVLKGCVEFTVGGKTFAMDACSAIYFDLGMPHQWRNVGTTTAEFLMVHPYVFQLFEQEEEDFIWARRKGGVDVRLTR
jgi:transcriptional regulator with XRE-family HTH domain